LKISTNATLAGFGTINGNIVNYGTIVSSGGPLTFNGIVTNNNLIITNSPVTFSGGLVNHGTIRPPCPTITVSPSTLPGGTINTPYNQLITASGGSGGYTYTNASGALPAGLSLNTSTGALTGTPTAPGSVTFTVVATDANGCQGSQQYTVVVSGPFAITAIARQGNDIRVTWTCGGGYTNILQSTQTAAGAGYSSNLFFDVSPLIIMEGAGQATTNYLDVGAASAPALTAPSGQIPMSTGTPSTVEISAEETRGLADDKGNAVPIGRLLMIGTFNMSEPTIQSNYNAGNLNAIMSAFTPYTNSFAVGTGTGQAASWNVTLSAAGYDGEQIYLLAVDQPTLATATQLGVFTAPSWVVPSNGGSISIDLEDVTDFVVGAHGGSLTINEGLSNYTFTDTARLSILPGRIRFYRVRLAP
jgi:putative Ig domain-containing protein